MLHRHARRIQALFLVASALSGCDKCADYFIANPFGTKPAGTCPSGAIPAAKCYQRRPLLTPLLTLPHPDDPPSS